MINYFFSYTWIVPFNYVEMDISDINNTKSVGTNRTWLRWKGGMFFKPFFPRRFQCISIINAESKFFVVLLKGVKRSKTKIHFVVSRLVRNGVHVF